MSDRQEMEPPNGWMMHLQDPLFRQPGYVYVAVHECDECGALVLNPDKHYEWHLDHPQVES